MKLPLEFHDPDYQQELLRKGTREQLIAWLRWNDPNGIYTDPCRRSPRIDAAQGS